MKQSKRLLCVLLSLIMIISGFTIGVSAYRSDYTVCTYNSVYEPVFTKEQGATAILDFLDDEVFAGLNVDEDISALSVHIHLGNLDSTFKSLKDIRESAYWGLVGGDLDKLNFSVPKDSSIRRASSSKSDYEVLYYLFKFLADNADPLYKLADNSLDLGTIVGMVIDLKKEVPMLNDLHGYINQMVYESFYDYLTTPFVTGSQYDNLDFLVNDILNNKLLKMVCDGSADAATGTNDIADFLGLATNPDGTLAGDVALLDVLPSMKATVGDSIDLTAVGTYDLINAIFSAAIDDIAIPLLGPILCEELDIDPNDPDAPNEDMAYVDMVVGLFVTYETVGLPEDASTADVMTKFLEMQGVENPDHPKPIDKINVCLKYILKEGITQYIYFQKDGNGGSYLTLAPDFVSQLSGLVKTVIPMLGSLWDDAPSLTDEEFKALAEMNDEQTFAFLVKILVNALTDDIEITHTCDTIRELATFTLLDVLKDIYPNVEFEDLMAPKDENGQYIGSQYNPNGDWCLDLAAALIDYYLVGEFGMETANPDPTQITFDQELNVAFDFFLEKYSTLFNISPASSDDVWSKAYYSINQIIPLTNICYGVEDSKEGLREIVMDKLLGSILDFDINGLLSLVGRRASTSTKMASLDKPLTQILMNLVARVINGLFQLPHYETAGTTDNATQKNLIIPYSYTKLDQLTTNINSDGANNGCGLKNTVRKLLEYLPNLTGSGSFCEKSLDLLASLLGIIDTDSFKYVTNDYNKNLPVGKTYSINELRTIYDELALSGNDGLEYYDDNYTYFHMIDFAPWAYLAFKNRLKTAKSTLDKYDAAKAGNGVFPSRTDITFNCYTLMKYKEVLLDNQTMKYDYQLNKMLKQVGTVKFEDNVQQDGSKKYTDRTWNAFWNAYQFANKVANEFKTYQANGTLMDYKQSKINTARTQLSKAYNALKAYIPLANYDELDQQIAQVLILESSPDDFTADSVNALVNAYKAAVTLDRDYDEDSQGLVDNYCESLAKAIERLEPIPTVEFYNSGMTAFEQNIDKRYDYVIGFEDNFWSADEQEAYGGYNGFNDYFTSYYGWSNDGEVRLVTTANGSGTGSKLCIYEDAWGDSPILKNSYTVVVFGDLNGDCKSDGQDAVLLKAYASLMLDPEFAFDYINYAGDLNFDGNIGNSDIKSVENAGVYKETIDQAPTECIGQNRTFADLVA